MFTWLTENNLNRQELLQSLFYVALKKESTQNHNVAEMSVEELSILASVAFKTSTKIDHRVIEEMDDTSSLFTFLEDQGSVVDFSVIDDAESAVSSTPRPTKKKRAQPKDPAD
uniref:Uncharacterized protein n=1 Tax=Timema bartmani TaxID=61472 RepID=A0A7R9F669_9NEOP|nr:unnamed protein product [Timema bartmani]